MNGFRRKFMCMCGYSAALTACGGGSDGGNPVTANARPQIAGCSLSAYSGNLDSIGCGQFTNSSGNAALDAAFLQEFQYQQSFWVLPQVSFTFLNDCDAPNAYANPSSMKILFGKTQAQQAFTRYGNALPLWQILAHEFGHMLQFAYGASWLQANTVAPAELEADMFSGFYLIYAKAFSSSTAMQTTLQQAFDIGDTGYNSRNH